ARALAKSCESARATCHTRLSYPHAATKCDTPPSSTRASRLLVVVVGVHLNVALFNWEHSRIDTTVRTVRHCEVLIHEEEIRREIGRAFLSVAVVGNGPREVAARGNE